MRLQDLNIGLLTCLSVLLLPAKSPAIERNGATGGRENALAQAVIALPGPFSVFHNQAFLTETKTISLGIGYRQPYSIAGYNDCYLALIFPTSSMVYAVGIAQSSIGEYKETNVGFSLAKELGRNFSAGILFNYFSLNFPESGHCRGSIQVDGGIRYQPSAHLSLGFHLQNMAVSKIETFQYSLNFPLVIRAGVSSRLTDRLLLSAETICEKYSDPAFRFGSEFLLGNGLSLRGGISTRPFMHSFGFGYTWSFCQLDFALVHHEILGYTPSLSFNFNFKR